MKGKIKTISAAILAAAICESFAGCANNKDDEINESNIESHLESLFGGGGNSSSPETSKTEEMKLEMTDEIKKAALNSGLIQLNNDIFQNGGYLTVAEFVEKYKDKYDIYYEDGIYEERKDYLIEYNDTFFSDHTYHGMRWEKRETGMGFNLYILYSLTLTPKDGKDGLPLTAYVVNATSPDEKITLDKAIVAEVSGYYSSAPEWIPMGLNDYSYKEYESENKSYTVKNIGEALEAKGVKKNSNFESYASLKPENYNTYWKGDNSFKCYVLGEENLFGAKPIYYYSFIIDPNTDKLEYANCSLEYFVKE